MRTKLECMRKRSGVEEEKGRVPAVSLQSLKTATSNKRLEKDGGDVGRRVNFCEIVIEKFNALWGKKRG